MSKTTYRLTPDSQSDLIKIRQYTLAQWGAEQSRNHIAELRRTMGLLAKTPFLGKSRPEVTENVLSFPQASHVIYYIVHGHQIVIFGVLHKRMVPTKHLLEREGFYTTQS